MARTPRVPVNGDVLQWARARMNLTVDQAASRLSTTPERLAAWEDQTAQPTLAQLRRAAALYRQTVAFFLRGAPPAIDEATRPPDFRIRQAGDAGLSLRLTAEIEKANERRRVFLDLTGPEPAGLPALTSEDPEEAARSMRQTLGVGVDTQQGWAATGAFRHWVDRLERLGILIFHMSRVDPEECQGFSLHFDAAPVIVVNGADSPQVRTFTIFHEVGHLLHRTGGICETRSRSGLEVWCNAFAADFLLPREDFRQALDPRVEVTLQIPELATRYRVSWSAVAVRLRNLGLIDQATLDQQLATAAEFARAFRAEQRERAKRTSQGPPHHLTHLRNLGPRYVYTVLDAVQEERISAVDASYFLDSKWSTIRRMEDDLLRRADQT